MVSALPAVMLDDATRNVLSKLQRAIRQHRRLADGAALALEAVESDETRARSRELLEFHCRRAVELSARLVGAVR